MGTNVRFRVAARLLRGWSFTAFLTVVAFYLVALPALAWGEAAFNQLQGGRSYLDDAAMDVLFGLIAPFFARMAWRDERRAGQGRVTAWRYGCLAGNLVGLPLLLLRVWAATPFF